MTTPREPGIPERKEEELWEDGEWTSDEDERPLVMDVDGPSSSSKQMMECPYLPLRCALCQERFPSRISLCRHLYSGHALPCCCAYCDQHFPTMEELVRHISTHQRGEINCWFCPTWYADTMTEFWHHIWFYHKPSVWKCNYCELHCFGKQSLLAHKTICDNLDLTPFRQARFHCQVAEFPLVGRGDGLRAPLHSLEVISPLLNGTELPPPRMDTEGGPNLRDPRIRKQIATASCPHITSQPVREPQEGPPSVKRKPESSPVSSQGQKVPKLEPAESPPCPVEGIKAEEQLLDTLRENAPNKSKSGHSHPGRKCPEINIRDVLGTLNGNRKIPAADSPKTSHLEEEFKQSSTRPESKTKIPDNKWELMSESKIEMSHGKGRRSKGASLPPRKADGASFQCSLCNYTTVYKQCVMKHLTGLHKVDKERAFNFYSSTKKTAKRVLDAVKESAEQPAGKKKNPAAQRQDCSASLLAEIQEQVESLKKEINLRKKILQKYD